MPGDQAGNRGFEIGGLPAVSPELRTQKVEDRAVDLRPLLMAQAAIHPVGGAPKRRTLTDVERSTSATITCPTLEGGRIGVVDQLRRIVASHRPDHPQPALIDVVGAETFTEYRRDCRTR